MSNWRRLMVVVLATLGGALVGVSASHSTPGSPDEVLAAFVLSPVAVMVGGGVVSPLFFVLGLCFWPVWLALVWRWWSRGEAWAVIALILWSAQAFFELLARFELVMSV